MKKLSLIAGLACLATVGGVFGAWVFGSTEDANGNVNVTLTVDTNVTTHGSLSVTDQTGSIAGYKYDQTAPLATTATLKEVGGTGVLTDFVITFSDGSEYAAGNEPTYSATATLTAGSEALAAYFVNEGTKIGDLTPTVDQEHKKVTIDADEVFALIDVTLEKFTSKTQVTAFSTALTAGFSVNVTISK